MVKRLLKKYKYPPEDYEFAISTVISQCELWTDNIEMPDVKTKVMQFGFKADEQLYMVAEDQEPYGKN